MKTTIFATLAASALALGLALSSPASAAVTLDAGEEGCDLYSTGCMFTHGGGGEFDDGDLIRAAYNLGHNATPAPEDLPELTLLGKSDEGITFVNNGNEFVFTDLPFDVSFFTIKTGPNKIVLFGLAPATDSFKAINTRIMNGNNPRAISHVTFFGADVGGGGGAIPEPATWAMMILGFGGVGAMMRRRRTALA